VSRALLLALVAAVSAAGGAAHRSAALPAAGFRVVGTEIRGPVGDAAFTPEGMNLLGPRAFFNADGKTRGLAKVLASAWRVNTVRLNTCLPEGCGYTGVVNRHNDDLPGIIRELSRRRIVSVVALHQTRPGGIPTGADLDAIEAWWRQTAHRYRDNPWVWFNVLNEPGHGKPAPAGWLTMHRRLIAAIRAEAPGNVIVVDGTNWGQEVGGRDEGLVDTANSAILRWGPQLQREFGNLVFSFHVYEQWGLPRDDAARDRRMADYIDRVHALGLPLVIGEVGGAWKECCEETALSAQTAYRVAPPRGVGMLWWHGQSVDEYKLVNADPPTSPDQIDDWRDPHNLTWQGQLLWDLTHR
jgi:mannan endo-1,4-beta-mannosidase